MLTANGEYFHALNERATFDRTAAEAKVRRVLESADEHAIDMIVLPELMIDADLRGILIDGLRAGKKRFPIAVVAGSFHFWREGEQPGLSPARNEAVMLGKSGDELLRHEKRGRFRIGAAAIQQMGNWFVQVPKMAQGAEVLEHLQWGPEIEVCDTELGRVALAVCADCIAPLDGGVVATILRARPDMLFVVSMTPETDRFSGAMEQFAQRGISTFFVNAACACVGRQGESLASVELGFLETSKSPATRYRWRVGSNAAEVSRHRRAGRRDKWKPHRDTQANPVGVWLALIDGAPEGLILDLGQHLG